MILKDNSSIKGFSHLCQKIYLINFGIYDMFESNLGIYRMLTFTKLVKDNLAKLKLIFLLEISAE